MATTYFIIEETERLGLNIFNPTDNKVYRKEGFHGEIKPVMMERTNKAEALKLAESCGMKVMVYDMETGLQYLVTKKENILQD